MGWSVDADGRRAAHHAARDALGGPDPRLLIAFATGDYDPGDLAAGFSEAALGVPLIGCSTEAVVTPDGPRATGVVVLALGGSGMSAATGAALPGDRTYREAGAEAAGCFSRVRDRRHRVMVLLTDGLVGQQEMITSGVYSVVGASVPLAGGSASPSPGMFQTFQIHGDGHRCEVLTSAVLAATIGSDAPIGMGLRHGWRRTGEPLVVTHSDHGLIKTLNDQPALPTYLRHLGAPEETYTDPAAFQAFARTRPLGVSRRSGEDLRDISSHELMSEGWLLASADVPEGGLVWLMEGDVASVLDAAGDAMRDAVAGLGGLPPLGLLAFDCVGRRGILGPAGASEEVASLVDGGTPVAGLYTWGEISRTRGISAYHNLTLVTLALG